MKIPAWILLLSLFIYLTETIGIPLTIFNIAQKPTCCSKLSVNSPAPCQRSNPDKNESSKCNSINCLNCPLGYNFTLQPVVSVDNAYHFIENHYPDMERGLLSEYFDEAWKPPDTI